uniref:Acyl-CoA_dh_1 domain-containing protein n=1 Tax=Panagrellus redivivus TaxID=6233 RepID=A0A7E4VNJ1_PANRE
MAAVREVISFEQSSAQLAAQRVIPSAFSVGMDLKAGGIVGSLSNFGLLVVAKGPSAYKSSANVSSMKCGRLFRSY